MADGWSTEQGYSPYHFYISSVAESRDGKDSGRTTFRVNVPGHVAAELLALVQSGKIPEYRTIQDVFRDAVVHRLQFIAHMIGDPELQSAVVAMRRQALIDRRIRQLDQQKRYVDSLDALLRELRSTGDHAQVLEVLEEQDPSALPETFRERAVEVMRNYKEEEGTRAR